MAQHEGPIEKIILAKEIRKFSSWLIIFYENDRKTFVYFGIKNKHHRQSGDKYAHQYIQSIFVGKKQIQKNYKNNRKNNTK